MLKRLGTSRSLSLVTTGRDANLALELICVLSVYFHPQQAPSCGLDTVIRLLAGVAPLVHPPPYMPTAAAVFGQRAIPSQMRLSYEKVRLSLGGPDCFILQIYLLVQELRRLSRPSKELQRVIGALETYSFLMGMALKDVSSACVAGNITAKSTKPKA